MPAITGYTTRQYKLDSATATFYSRAGLPSTLPASLQYGKDKSLIKLQVTGKIQDPNGNTRSTATIVREYEVVPKCCERSFGRSTFETTTFGIDNRVCEPGTNSGLGLILGINGAEPQASNSLTIYNQSDQPIYSSLRALVAYETDFKTPFPSFPQPTLTAESVTTRANGQNTPYNYIVGRGNSVVQCKLNNLADCQPLPSCLKTNDQYYCRLTSINSRNALTIFDSSYGAINLFFDGEAQNNNFSYIDLGGSGAISHVFCQSPTSSACSTPAAINEAIRLNMYIYGKKANGEAATLEIKGSSRLLQSISSIYGHNKLGWRRQQHFLRPKFPWKIMDEWIINEWRFSHHQSSRITPLSILPPSR